MNINQPTENPNIPSELKKQIDAVRNQVSIAEGDLRRLSDLVISQKYEVNQLVKQKKELEDQVAKLTDKSILESGNESLRQKNQDLLKEKTSAEETIAKAHFKLQVREEAVKDSEDILQKKNYALLSDSKALEASKIAHAKDKEAFHARVTKLNEALK